MTRHMQPIKATRTEDLIGRLAVELDVETERRHDGV